MLHPVSRALRVIAAAALTAAGTLAISAAGLGLFLPSNPARPNPDEIDTGAVVVGPLVSANA